MNISVSATAAQSLSQCSTGFVLALTDHFPGILQVKVKKANMRSRFFCNIDRQYVVECALYFLYIYSIY